MSDITYADDDHFVDWAAARGIDVYDEDTREAHDGFGDLYTEYMADEGDPNAKAVVERRKERFTQPAPVITEEQIRAEEIVQRAEADLWEAMQASPGMSFVFTRKFSELYSKLAARRVQAAITIRKRMSQ